MRYQWVQCIMIAGFWLSINTYGTGSNMKRAPKGAVSCKTLEATSCEDFILLRKCCGMSGGREFVQCYWYESDQQWRWGYAESCADDEKCYRGTCVPNPRVNISCKMLILH